LPIVIPYFVKNQDPNKKTSQPVGSDAQLESGENFSWEKFCGEGGGNFSRGNIGEK